MKYLKSKNFLGELLSKVEEGLNKQELEQYLELDIYDLLYLANRTREKNFGNTIKFCSIMNVKSGRCSEDCRFCSQSAHYNTNAPVFELKKPDEVLKSARDAEKNGAARFGLVASGKGLTDEKDWERVFETVRLIKKETGIEVDASLGSLTLRHAILLKESGASRYHHNLETSPSFFPNICTTHTYRERLDTIKAVKEAGLFLCCGGIFGLGETWQDRIEFAFILKEISPDSIPLNFLNPIPGTPLENTRLLTPQECLKIIAIFRLIIQDKDISVCGGREKNLLDMQSWMYYAGANASMLGNYLTTFGRQPEEDLKMVRELGLTPLELPISLLKANR